MISRTAELIMKMENLTMTALTVACTRLWITRSPT